MRYRSSPHTHTNLCDGKNTPREMVRAAIQKGLTSIGFSGHAYTPHDTTYCMTPKTTEQYIRTVSDLKREFRGQIEIFLGIEVDATSQVDLSPFDYVIGSVHYLGDEAGEHYWPLDDSPQKLQSCCHELFADDGLALVLAYYQAVREMALRIRPDVIAHYDLITKCNRGVFDETSATYRQAALSPLDDILTVGSMFEVNAGAIERGYTQAPYPAPFILQALCSKGADMILSSDAHSVHALGFYWEEMTALLQEAGFSTMRMLGGGGFVTVPLSDNKKTSPIA